MMPFMLLAAAMVLLALALVIVPLLRSAPTERADAAALAVLADGMRELQAEHAAGELSAAEFEQARERLERQALQAQQQAEVRHGASVRANWGAALATAIVLPLGAVLLYLAVGQPLALTGGGAPGTLAGADHAPDDRAIAALSQRLAKDGSDAEGWVLLARSYFQVNRTHDALGAYRKATALMADNPDLWVEYANTLAIANDRNLAGEPEQLVERALKLDPNNFNALAFAGLAALQRDDRAGALRHWQRLQSLVPEGSEDRARIDSLIARAQGQAPGEAALAPPAVAAGPAAAPAVLAVATRSAGDAPVIRGTVTLAGELAAKVAPSDTLFVFAKAPNGPPMPLAAVRTRAAGWPVAFTLDDSSAMAQGMALSRFTHVNIVARISRLGNASAQPGDIEGTLDNVAVGDGEVRVVLDRVVGR